MVLNNRSIFLEEWATDRLQAPQKSWGKICDFLKSGGGGKKEFLKVAEQLPHILILCDAHDQIQDTDYYNRILLPENLYDLHNLMYEST